MAGTWSLRPAFPSWHGAAAFGSLLGFFLTLPYTLPYLPGYDPAHRYEETPDTGGNQGFFEREIFASGDVDILVLGASLAWVGLDTDLIRAEMTAKLGREATVLNFAGNWRAEDNPYVMFSELLAHRKVTLAIFDPPRVGYDAESPHALASYWFLYPEHPAVMAELDLSHRATYFAESVLGGPRHLLSLIGNAPDNEPSMVTNHHVVNLGYNGRAYVARDYPPPRLSAADATYSDATKAHFVFGAGKPLNQVQLAFIKGIGALAREHGVALATVSMVRDSEASNTTLDERAYWPDVFGLPVTMIGVPGNILYEGLTRAEVEDLYYNIHLNASGSRYFTAALLPAIEEAYDRATLAD